MKGPRDKDNSGSLEQEDQDALYAEKDAGDEAQTQTTEQEDGSEQT